MTDYLTLAEVVAMHRDLVERYGGASGIRDVGLLDAALHRPRSGYYSDLIEQASALWESLDQNHPFLDGNKRVAFAAAYTFLLLNGVRIAADPLTAFREMAALRASGDFDAAHLAQWLRDHTRSTVAHD